MKLFHFHTYIFAGVLLFLLILKTTKWKLCNTLYIFLPCSICQQVYIPFLSHFPRLPAHKFILKFFCFTLRKATKKKEKKKQKNEVENKKQKPSAEKSKKNRSSSVDNVKKLYKLQKRAKQKKMVIKNLGKKRKNKEGKLLLAGKGCVYNA